MESEQSGEKNNTTGVALKAGMWYVVSSVMVKAVSVITTPIFTRILTTDEYGYVSTFTTWYSLLLVICSLNLTYSIGRAKIDFPNKLDDYIGSSQLLSLIISVAIAVLMLVFIDPVSSLLTLSKPLVYLLLAYLVFSPAINFVQNGFRYRYKYKQNIVIAWYTAVVTSACSLIFILCFDGDGAFWRCAGVVLPTIVLSSVCWINSVRKKHVRVNVKYWKYGMTLSIPLVIHTLSLHILASSDRIFITNICGASNTGIYSLVYQYGTLLSIVTNAISEGWLPWFHDTYHAKKFEDIRKNVKLIVVLGCYAGLACIALAPEAISILGGEKYAAGASCVPPIVLGIICQYIYTHYVNIELHLKKTKYVSFGTIFAALLNIILNIVFIPKYGFVAAAYTTLISYIFLLVIHFIITRKVLHIKLYNDLFIFGSFAVTALISIPLIMTYSMHAIRYIMIAVGFASFVYVYRNYIFGLKVKSFQ